MLRKGTLTRWLLSPFARAAGMEAHGALSGKALIILLLRRLKRT